MEKFMNFIKNKPYISAFIVLFTTILLYSTLVVTKKYESKAVINLTDKSSNSISAAAAFLGISTGSNDYMKDIKSLESFISSESLFEKIDSQYNLRNLYSDSSYVNFYERLFSFDYKEEFIERFATNTRFFYDIDFNVIEISFISHSSDFSNKVLNSIIKELENVINKQNKFMVDNELKFIKKEVNSKLSDLNNASDGILKFQERFSIFNPDNDIKKELSFLFELDKQILEQGIELKNKKKFMHKKNPEIVKLRNSLYNLKAKRKEFHKKLLGEGSNKASLNQLIFSYKKLEEDLRLKSEIYAQTLITFEKLKIDSVKKNKILSVIIKPTHEEMPYFPNYSTFVPLVFLLLLLSLFIVKSILAIVKEH